MQDGITNPSPVCTSDGTSSGQICANHISTVSDDDGGYLRMIAQEYFANPYSLTGSSSTATPTPTITPVAPTSTPTNTPTSTPTNTPAPTPTSAPTSTPTARPVATSTPVAPTATPASLHVTINSASASPTTVRRGSTTTLSTTITASASLSGAIVDFEIYNSAGSKIYQATRSPISFAEKQAKTITASWAVPTTQATGGYTIKIGVFGSGWTPLYAWNNGGATITVS